MGDSNKNEEHVNGFRKLRSRVVWHMLSFPIFLKIMGIGFLTAILFGSVTLLQTRVGTTRILSQLQKQKVLSTTRLLVNTIEKSAGDGDIASITQSLEQIRGIYPEIRYVIVRYPDGRVMTSAPERGIPQDILDIPGTSCPPDCETRIFNDNDSTIYEARAPVLDGSAGTIQAGFIDDIVSQGLETFTWTVLWGLLLCIAIGACLALLLTNILTRPLHHLVESANRIRKGNFETRADIFSNDEVGHLAVAFNQMADALNQYQREVQEKEKARVSLIERIVQVQEEERKSISRELHDHLGQSLLAMLLQVQSIRSQANLPDSAYQNVENSVRQAIDEVHRLAWGMRPSILDDYGLDSALARHIEEVSRHFELEIDYSFSSPPDLTRLPGRIEVCLFRIAQEAITNVHRHAAASHASVVVLRQLNDITMLVEDNGQGFNLSMLQEKRDECMGLIGMKERVALLGGQVTIESIPGDGTTIRVRVPLDGGSDTYANTDSR
jgi:signal transduction histidine kinase